MVGAKPGDFYPAAKRDLIDAINELVYNGFNNGVYRAGFATEQQAYKEAVTDVFDVLDKMDQKLASPRRSI